MNMSEGIINIWWLVSYILLSVITIISIGFALIKFSEKGFRSAIGKLLIANSFIAVGIIVHTAAILEFGTDLAQMTEFVVGHLLLLAGFVTLAFGVREIKKISKEMGFA